MKKMIIALVLSGLLPAAAQATCLDSYRSRLASVGMGNEVAMTTGGLAAGTGALGVATGLGTGSAAALLSGGAFLITGAVGVGVTTTTQVSESRNLEAVLSLIQESQANDMGGLHILQLQEELKDQGIDRKSTEIVNVIREIDGSGLLCAGGLMTIDEVKELVAGRLNQQ